MTDANSDYPEDVPTRGGSRGKPVDASEQTMRIPESVIREITAETGAFVQLLTGRAAGRLYPVLDGGMTIGRSRDCHISLDDGSVSRRHAQIDLVGEANATVCDLGSTNGVFVNGRRVTKADLADGDRFQVGAEAVFSFAVRDRREQEVVSELYHKATRDPLTGLFNKGHVVELALKEFHRTARDGKPISLILLDVDHFKSVNDRFGHTPAGDTVLQAVAATIARNLRSGDVVGRFGGEEFLAILAGAPRSAAFATAERIRRAVAAEPVSTRNLKGEGVRIPLTLSAGVACRDSDKYANPETLLSAADRALYQAKGAGRNRVCTDIPLPPPPAAVKRTTSVKLGRLLMEMGVITPAQLREALEVQERQPARGPLGGVLIALGHCTSEEVARALAMQYGVEKRPQPDDEN